MVTPAFRIETGDAKILIDPFFTGNPTFPESDREQAIEGLTHIAITHGHGDHIGDSVCNRQADRGQSYQQL